MFKGNKILCIVPARHNSKGIKNKNLQKIDGKPLIFFPIRSSLNSKYIDKTIFTSDAKLYQKIAIKFGAESPILRPKKLAKDNSRTYDVLKHILDYLEKRQIFFDIIVLLEPTSPLTTSRDIDYAIKKFINFKYNSLVSVTDATKFNLNFQFKKVKNFIKPLVKKNNHLRRQDVKKSYALDGSLYISKIKHLIKNKGFISDKTCGLEFPKWKTIEIDDKNDLLLSRMTYKIKKYEIKKIYQKTS